MDILAVAVGGFFGAIFRYLLGLFIPNFLHPLETLLANLLGSFLLGTILASKIFSNNSWHKLKLCLGTGLIGSFTTFSTFTTDTLHLLENSILTACLYIIASLTLCLLFSYFGIQLVLSRKERESK